MDDLASVIRSRQLDGATVDDGSLADLDIEAGQKEKLQDALAQLKQYFAALENQQGAPSEEAVVVPAVEPAEGAAPSQKEPVGPSPVEKPEAEAALATAPAQEPSEDVEQQQAEGLRSLCTAFRCQTALTPAQAAVDREGFVFSITAEANDLTGSIIKDALATTGEKLNRLTKLRLSHNMLNGSIPEEISHLVHLQVLDLGKNKLSGSLPESISYLVNMTSLNLFSNCLTGPIPAAIGSLAKLKTLHLGSNKLTGTIPAEIGNLTALTELGLGTNDLSGDIPPDIGKLTNVVTVHLSKNQLTGPIPESIGSLSSVTSLNLRSNMCSGTIPAAICRLGSLQVLDLGKNDFRGVLPRELKALTKLRKLHLDANNFNLPVSKNPFEQNLNNELHGSLDCKDPVSVQRMLSKRPWEAKKR